MGWRGKASQRVLRANTTKAKNKMPAVNLERSAPAKLKPNSNSFLRLGRCHVSANCHNVSREKRVTEMSVCNRGAKTRKAGVVTKKIRHSKPPQFSPNSRSEAY